MTAPITRERFHTADEIAAWLGLTPATIRQWARDGVIRGHQPGGRVWLFKVSEVEDDISRERRLRVDAAPTPVRRQRPTLVSTEPITSIRERLRQGKLGATS